jgi:hypothetical protein
MIRVHISFTAPARVVDYRSLLVGVPHPMVLIAEVGSASFIWLIRQRTTENYLQHLQNVGCFMPDLSYFNLRQLEVGESNVVRTTEMLCRAH